MTKPKTTINLHQHTPDISKPFIEHIGELRQRLLAIVIAIALAATLSYFYRDQVLSLLLRPLGEQQLYYATPLGAMSFTFEICMLAGIVLACPIWLYQLWSFLKPVIPEEWQHRFWIWILTSSLLAILGALYGYGVSLPATLLVSKYFQTDHLTPLLSATEYLSFVTKYILAFSLFFQIPLVVFFSALAGFVSPADLVRHQRHSFVASVVVGAVLTPTPDFVNQLALALPLFVLYEISVGAVLLSERLSKKEEGRVEASRA